MQHSWLVFNLPFKKAMGNIDTYICGVSFKLRSRSKVFAYKKKIISELVSTKSNFASIQFQEWHAFYFRVPETTHFLLQLICFCMYKHGNTKGHTATACVANKEELPTPEALENQHRCGWIHPPHPPCLLLLHNGTQELTGVTAVSREMRIGHGERKGFGGGGLNTWQGPLFVSIN